MKIADEQERVFWVLIVTNRLCDSKKNKLCRVIVEETCGSNSLMK